MSQIIEGAYVTVRAQFDAAPPEPVRLTLRPPGGDAPAPVDMAAVSGAAAHTFTADVRVTVAGRWRYRVETAAPQAVVQGEFVVSRSNM